MNDISMECSKHSRQWNADVPAEVSSLLRVITEHFTHDALGNDLSETLLYCESMVGDFDRSYSANWKASDYQSLNNGFIDDDSITDSERQLHDNIMHRAIIKLTSKNQGYGITNALVGLYF